MCFNVLTLIKIGARAEEEKALQVARSSIESNVFDMFPWRQPPHFRTSMELSMVEQLKHRFAAKDLLQTIRENVGGGVADEAFEEEYESWRAHDEQHWRFVRLSIVLAKV